MDGSCHGNDSGEKDQNLLGLYVALIGHSSQTLPFYNRSLRSGKKQDADLRTSMISVPQFRRYRSPRKQRPAGILSPKITENANYLDRRCMRGRAPEEAKSRQRLPITTWACGGVPGCRKSNTWIWPEEPLN